MEEPADQAAGNMSARAMADALETLIFHWGEAYLIGRDDEHGWWAVRRDQIGHMMTAGDPDALHKLIADDYAFRPVRREDVEDAP